MPTTPVIGRASVIRSAHVRLVPGSDLEAGMVLPTGVILQVSLDHDARDARLEMPGATVHYVEFDETVAVLATVSGDLLDEISVETVVSRAATHATSTTTQTTSTTSQEG